jgi:hypothetical protein
MLRILSLIALVGGAVLYVLGFTGIFPFLFPPLTWAGVAFAGLIGLVLTRIPAD